MSDIRCTHRAKLALFAGSVILSLLFSMCSGGNSEQLDADTRYNFIIESGDTLACMVRPVTRLRMTVNVAEKMKDKRDWIAKTCLQFVEVENGKLTADKVKEVKVFTRRASFLESRISDEDWIFYSEPLYEGYKTLCRLSSAEEWHQNKLRAMAEGVKFEVDGIRLKVVKRDHNTVSLVISEKLTEEQIRKAASLSECIADYYFYLDENEAIASDPEKRYASFLHESQDVILGKSSE